MSYNKSVLMPGFSDCGNVSDLSAFATLNDSQRNLLVRKLQEIVDNLEPQSDAFGLAFQLLNDLSSSVGVDYSFSLNLPGAYEFQVLSQKSLSNIPARKKTNKPRKLGGVIARPHKLLMKYVARSELSDFAIITGVGSDVHAFQRAAALLTPNLENFAYAFDPTEDLEHCIDLFDNKLIDRINETNELRAENKYHLLVEGDERFTGFD